MRTLLSFSERVLRYLTFRKAISPLQKDSRSNLYTFFILRIMKRAYLAASLRISCPLRYYLPACSE